MTADPLSTRTVLLASEEVLVAWSARHASSTDVIALAEADTQHALDVIARRRPDVVVIEQRFLSTARGQTFVHQLRNDADLPPVEIRVLPAEHVATLSSLHSPAGRAPAALIALAQPLQGPVRRAVRVQIPDGVQIQVDGVPTELVDLSVLGAQIVSPRTLKPSQKVRVQLADDSGTYRAIAGVAWSSFELRKGQPPQYRVGMEFDNADPDALEAFYSRLATSAPVKKGRR